MNHPVVYVPEAEDDVAAAYDHYEQQRAGLGNEFLDALRDCVGRIEQNPQAHGLVWRDIRATLLRRFPYVVYYRPRGQDVLVIAVQHGRRSSRAWRKRC